jgi:hypothetical protein
MTHGIVQEVEQTLEGVRYWVVRCECGQVFSSKFAAGLTPRRSARAAFRRHLEEVPA